MNREAVARELVAIAQLIAKYRYDQVFEGPTMRLSFNEGKGDFLLEEMPQKGMKRCRRWHGDVAPWVSRGQDRNLGIINILNVVAKIFVSMSYDQVKGSMLKEMERLTEMVNVETAKTGGKTYKVTDLFSHHEGDINYLQVEPTNAKPFEAEGKGFTVDVGWNEFSAYSPDSDFQQADPYYTMYGQSSPTSARKLYKILKANPNALKSISWMEFRDWLTKTGIGSETHFSQWH